MPSWTFYKAPTTTLEALRAVSDPGVFEYMVHLERLEGLEICRFHYVPLTDELQVTVRYWGYGLHIWMDWGGDLVVGAGDEIPTDVFQRVCDHFKSYRSVPRADIARAKTRYGKIAKSAG